MHELSQSHIPNAHTLSHRTASHSYVNVAYKSPVASRQRLAFLNVLRITYNLLSITPAFGISIIHIPQQQGFHNYHSLIVGISTILFNVPSRCYVWLPTWRSCQLLMRMQCHMLCHSISMLWNAFYIAWHSCVHNNKHIQYINSMFLNL